MNQKKLWDRGYSLKVFNWRKETKPFPVSLKGKSVLELGVGNGKTLATILNSNPKEVYAVDFSEEAIKITAKKFNSKKLQFFNKNIVNLPFEDSKFDVVVCYYVLNNLLQKEREKAVKEIFRVLKKKGVVLFEDFAADDLRQHEKKVIEENTVQNANGLICHFFSMPEIKNIFRDFSKFKLKRAVSFPIKSRKVKRVLIKGVIVK